MIRMWISMNAWPFSILVVLLWSWRSLKSCKVHKAVISQHLVWRWSSSYFRQIWKKEETKPQLCEQFLRTPSDLCQVPRASIWMKTRHSTSFFMKNLLVRKVFKIFGRCSLLEIAQVCLGKSIRWRNLLVTVKVNSKEQKHNPRTFPLGKPLSEPHVLYLFHQEREIGTKYRTY